MANRADAFPRPRSPGGALGQGRQEGRYGLPLAETWSTLDFTDPVNEPLRPRVGDRRLPGQPACAVLIGGTGTGKSHLAVAIARACIGDGATGPLLQRRRPGQPARGRSPRRPPGPARRSAGPARPRHGLDELGPALRPNRRPLLFHLVSRLYERTSIDRHHQPDRRRHGRFRLRRRQDDHALLDRLTHHARSSRCGNDSWRFKTSVLKATDPPAPGRPGEAHRLDRQRHARSAARRGGRVGPRAGPSYGLPVRPPPCIPKGATLHADRGSMFNAD